MKYFWLFLFALVLSVSSSRAQHTEVTIEDTQSITGPKTMSQLNNIIFVDGVTYPRSIAGIASARSALGTGPGRVVLTPGNYSDDCSTTVNMPNAFQSIEGMSKGEVTIIACPSRTNTIFNVGTASNENLDEYLGGFIILGAGTAAKSPAIVLINLAEQSLHDIDIRAWNGGGTSIGIDNQGRELNHWNRLYIVADLPVKIDPDPAIATISMDETTWDQIWMQATASTPCITVPTNVVITHWHVSQAGCGISTKFIDWNETTTGGPASLDITFENVHHEQGAGGGNYSYDFQRAASTPQLQGFVCVNCAADASSNGWRMQNAVQPTFINPRHINGSGTSFSFSSSVSDPVIINRNVTGTISSSASSGNGNTALVHMNLWNGFAFFGYNDGGVTQTFKLDAFSGQLQGKTVLGNQGTALSNGAIALGAGWGTGAAPTVCTGPGWTNTGCFTITSGSASFAAAPTVTITLPNALPSSSTPCTLDVHAITGAGGAIIFDETTFSATAPVFTATTSAGAAFTPAVTETYKVVLRCGP